MNVELIDMMGDDQSVVRAARVSTKGSDSNRTEDHMLINYLMREGHFSPFEHVVFTFKVTGPIFAAREFMRHRMASYNEESGRYKVLDTKFYIPDPSRALVQIGKTGDYVFTDDYDPALYDLMVDQMIDAYTAAKDAYEAMLEAGIAKEVARMVLPVSTYTTWYVTMNARSLMNFLNLRTAPNAQYEIRDIAGSMEYLFKEKTPIIWETWNANGRKKT